MIMKKLLLMLSVWVVSATYAQTMERQLVGSAGGQNQIGNVLVEHSIGEPIVGSTSSSSHVLTSGFHQPQIVVFSLEENSEMFAKIFPNPSNGIVYVQPSNELDVYSLQLMDVSGKLLLQKDGQGQMGLDLHSYANGIYFLSIMNSKQALKHSFKIIKQN